VASSKRKATLSSTEPPPRAEFSAVTVGLLLVFVTLGVYWQVTNHGFVDYDDADYAMANPKVHAGLTWEGVKWAFMTGHISNWHPITWLSHQLDATLFGQQAGAHHGINLLFHCANTLLVFGWLRALTGANWRSAIVAGLFALHPLHVESVAWISERKDLLSGFFALLTLCCYTHYVREKANPSPGARRWYAVALFAFAIGLMSKPMLVTLPFVMLLLDYWPLDRIRSAPSHKPENWKRLSIEKVPFLALVVASSVVTFIVQQKGGAVSPLTGLSLWARVANAFVSYARYLGKTFWPNDLSVLYPHPGHWPALQVAGAMALFAMICLAVWLLRARAPFLFVGWFWFAGMLVPVIGLVQVGIQSMADRYTYFPSIGLFIALVWSVAVFMGRQPQLKPIFVGVAALSVATCALLTYFQTRIWQNSETLFSHAVKVTRANYLAYNNLGFYYSKLGRTAEAMENFQQSLRINPNYADALNNVGHALANQGKPAEAIGHYRAALRTNPNSLEIHNNLGNALAETGDVEGAIVEYQFVLQRDPQHADAHNNYGIALAMKGQVAEAIEHFNQALRTKPGSAYGNLGNAYAAQRKWPEAIEHYRKALELFPNDAQTHNNLGNVLSELGQVEAAVTNYAAALRIKGENPEAHFNLGIALLRLRRPSEAAEHFREALRLRPGYEAARQQLQLLEGKRE
jgi:tetratricopeptide (TPR) repeat protein